MLQESLFVLYSLLVVVVASFLNNVRGGTVIPELAKFMDYLPKSTYWLWIFIFPIAFIYGFNWQTSLTLAIGSLIWAIFPWSRWASLYHTTPAYNSGRPLSAFEKFIDAISFGNMYLGLFNRHIICLVPVVAVSFVWVGFASFWLFALAIGSVLGYTVGWWLFDMKKVSQPFPTGEFTTGAFAGIALVLMHLFSIGTVLI